MKKVFIALLVLSMLIFSSAGADAYKYVNDYCGISITFPENWIETHDDKSASFYAPDKEASVVVTVSGTPVNRELFDSITAQNLVTWTSMDDDYQDFRINAMAKVMDENGNLYAIGMGEYMAGEQPMIHNQYLFSNTDKTLGRVVIRGENPASVDEISAILESAVLSNTTEAISEELLSQLNANFSALGQDIQSASPAKPTSVPAAQTASPGSPTLGDYAFQLKSASLDEFLGTLVLKLEFDFTNDGAGDVLEIPFDASASKNGEALFSFGIARVNKDTIAPRTTVPFTLEFVLPDMSRDGDVKVVIGNHFDAGIPPFEATLRLDDLEASIQAFNGQPAEQGQTIAPQNQTIQADLGQPQTEPGRTSSLFESSAKQSEDRGDVYAFGPDEIQSVPSIVGPRKLTLTATGSGLNYVDMDYTYASDTVRDDLIQYIDYLGEIGYEVVAGAPLSEPGEGELSASSKEAGYTLHVRLDWTLDSYRVRFIKKDAGRDGNTGPQGAPAEADSEVLDRAQALSDALDHEGAMKIYDEAIIASPDVALYHFGRAEQLYYLARDEEGLEAVDAAIGLNPDDGAYDFLRGLFLTGLERYEEAVAAFDAALAKGQNDARTYLRRGEALVYLDRYDEALQSYDKAKQLEPSNSEVHNSIGVALYYANRAEEAKEALRLAIDLDPSDADPYNNLAYMQYEAGELEDAVMTCAFGISAVEYDVDLLILLGYVQMELGHYSEALEAFNKAIATGDVTAADIKDYETAKEKASAPAPTAKPGTNGLSSLFGSAKPMAPPSPAPSPKGESQLKNYKQWLEPYVEQMPLQRMLDRQFSSTAVEGDQVEEAVEYPAAWPGTLLEGAVPEYTGIGWMFDQYVTHPKMSYNPKHISSVAVTIYEYQENEMAAYIDSLLGYGYQEFFSGSAYDSFSQYLTMEGVESIRCFQRAGQIMCMVFGEGEGGMVRVGTSDVFDPLPFVEICVHFDRPAYALSTAVSRDTKLLNHEQAGSPKIPGQEGYALNEADPGQVDENGRRYTFVGFPSHWPKDIFGDLVPEYKYEGMLLSSYETVPDAAPNPDEMLIYTLYLSDYGQEDVERYARELIAYGYRELPRDEFNDSELEQAKKSTSYRIFAVPGFRYYVSTFAENGVDKLAFCLRYDGRYLNFWQSLGYRWDEIIP